MPGRVQSDAGAGFVKEVLGKVFWGISSSVPPYAYHPNLSIDSTIFNKKCSGVLK